MGKPPTSTGEPDTDSAVTNPPINIGTELARERARQGGSGDGTGEQDGTILVRVAHLETRMSRVEDKLDTALERLGAIATRGETRSYLLIAVGSFIGLIAVLVSAMGWLETRASRVGPAAATSPAPVIIQIPYPQPAPIMPTPTPTPTPNQPTG